MYFYYAKAWRNTHSKTKGTQLQLSYYTYNNACNIATFKSADSDI